MSLLGMIGGVDDPEVWFSGEWIYKPPSGWEVDWDAIDEKARAWGEEHIDESDEDWIGASDRTYYSGMLIRCLSPQRAWALTGEFDGRNNLFKARWPD